LLGSEIVQRVALDHESDALMLGGPRRRSFIVCGSDSHDPADVACSPRATRRVVEVEVEVEVPGAGTP
jgi:hypothetical protein